MAYKQPGAAAHERSHDRTQPIDRDGHPPARYRLWRVLRQDALGDAHIRQGRSHDFRPAADCDSVPSLRCQSPASAMASTVLSSL